MTLEASMSITVGAIYENGVLKPDTPLELQEKSKVRVSVVGFGEGSQQTGVRLAAGPLCPPCPLWLPLAN